jgi:signal transduction histidine kinase
MALELAEIAAGLPMAASLALVGGFRGVRRRIALNEAIHEVRRPLQNLALSMPSDGDDANSFVSTLQMAAVALERLEQEINGAPVVEVGEEIEVDRLATGAGERWRSTAAAAGRSLHLRLGSKGRVRGRRTELEQALDNLISNGLVHGGGDLTVSTGETADGVTLEVRDSAPVAPAAKPSWRRRGRLARAAGRSAHGHGLRIVRRIAAAHGGSFELRMEQGETRAVLFLPAVSIDE